MFLVLKKYFEIYKVHLKKAFSYRFEFGLWAILHPIRLVILYYLWSSIFSFSGAATLGGFTLSEMIFYFVTSSVLDTYVGIDRRLPQAINSGDVITFLTKPYKIFFNYLAIEFGNRTIAAIFHMLPVAVFAFFFFGYRIASIPFTLLAIFSALLALLINFEYSYIFSTFTFWTEHYYGIRTFKEGILYLASGWILPISLYPLVVQKILMYTPFPYMTFVPNMIFLGKYQISYAFILIGIQIGWIVALYGVHRLVWKMAERKFTGVGV